MRGGTVGTNAEYGPYVISIHPPHAGWDLYHRWRLLARKISIHPPHAGWDSKQSGTSRTVLHFNPPTPCGVGRYKNLLKTAGIAISIHPPHAGWDFIHRTVGSNGQHFNPPTPCGVGPLADAVIGTDINFNPPTPCGVGLPGFTFHEAGGNISIHPPHAGWDPRCEKPICDLTISIHPPHAGWDPAPVPIPEPAPVFQSTHPMRGGTGRADRPTLMVVISIHPPHAGWDP